MSTTTSLSPPSELASAVPASGTAIDAVNKSVTALENTKTTSSSYVPKLAGHIATAKQHASEWQDKICPSIVDNLHTVSNWNSTFDRNYQKLSTAAQQIANNDSDGVANFKSVLSELQAATKTLSSKISSNQPVITQFDSEIQSDTRDFQSDQQTAEAAKASASSQISVAKSKLKSLEAEKAKKDAILAGLGFLSPLAYGIEKLIEALGGQIGVQEKTIKQAQAQLSKAQAVENVINDTISVTQSYESSSASTAGALNQLLNGWETLESNLNTLLESEDITTFNVFTQDVLASVKSDWQNLADQANSIG